MKNVVKKITKNKWSIYIAIFVVGILIAIPMLNIQILDTHDGKMHILRIIGLKNSMEKSTFPSPFSTVTWQSLDSRVPAMAGLTISMFILLLIR